MTTNRLAKSNPDVTFPTSVQGWCDKGNEHLREIGRSDVEWATVDGKPILRFVKSAYAMLLETRRNRKDPMDRRGPMSEADTYALNKELERLGATKRYRADGSKYDVREVA